MDAHGNGDPKQHNTTKSCSTRPPAGEEQEHADASYCTHAQSGLQL